MSFGPKLAQSLNMIIVFVAVVCFFFFITEAGYDEINDVRN